MASQVRQQGSSAKPATRLLAAVLFLFFATACERRAPGPEECHDLALAWILGTRASQLPSTRVGPAAQEAILERTTDCLTTPYDRELLQCVTTASSPRVCLMGFKARHGAPVE